MGVLHALRRTPGALGRAPSIVVPQLAVFVLILPQLLLQQTNPVASIVVSLVSSALFLVATPFLQGGTIGMADEALTTSSSLSTFVAEGRDNYLSLLLAYVVLLVVNGVLVAAAFAAGFGAFLAHDAVRTALLVLAGVVGLVYLLVAFFVQFYGQAIVVDGASALASFKRSYRVVRSNLLATVGYMLLAVVIGSVGGAAYAGVSFLARPEATATYGLPTLSLAALAGVGLLAAVVGSVVSAFALTFSVAVYEELRD
jgi:hypothetical protein